ncbi:hypothetical protein E7T09_01505 [Deinococcus sp. KSM4-11]|nr:hypothetical protein E7T09_01505 [Deinococcus sp. KSM4-11]
MPRPGQRSEFRLRLALQVRQEHSTQTEAPPREGPPIEAWLQSRRRLVEQVQRARQQIPTRLTSR